MVWSIARRVTRTRAKAEKAVQEIFTEVWRTAGRFDPAQASEKVFIATIARRRLIDRMRSAAGRDCTGSVDNIRSPGWTGTRHRAEACAEAVTAGRAVMQLRPELRQVLDFGVLQGLSHAEISEALQLPLDTVKTRMRRGLIQVRECGWAEN